MNTTGHEGTSEKQISRQNPLFLLSRCRASWSVKALIALVFAVSLLSFAPPAQAQVLDKVCEGVERRATVCQDNVRQDPNSNVIYGPDGILTKVANILSIVVGIVSIFVIIISGIRFVISGGDPSKVNSARNNLIYAIIALVLAGVAQTLIVFVLNRL